MTGGHRAGEEIVDVLFDGRNVTEFRSERVSGPTAHGTGCAFSSALAAFLATGHGLPEAVKRAQAYVASAIREAPAIGRGHRLLDHFWNTRT